MKGLANNPAFLAYNKCNSELPQSDMRVFMSLGGEGMLIKNQISQAEQKAFSDSELIDIAKEIVRNIIDGSAELKKGQTFDNFNFDIRLIRKYEDLHSDVDKAPSGKEEKDEKILLAIKKREIINALTQGFAITSQSRMFDSDMDDVVNKIDSELLQKYFKFLKVTLDSHKYVNREEFYVMMKEIQNRIDYAEENNLPRPSSSGMIVPAKMEVVYVDGNPVIKVEAENLILVIQEMVKGIFEVISHYSFSTFTKEEKERIYSKTENWFVEQEGFVFGPKMVQVFKEFFRVVEDYLIVKGVINEYDDTMIINVLNALYYEKITPNEKFIEIFSLIFNKDLDKELWPIEKVTEIYTEIIGERGFYMPNVCEHEYDGSNNLPIDDEILILDKLIDKIIKSGEDSLSPKEKEILKKYSKE